MVKHLPLRATRQRSKVSLAEAPLNLDYDHRPRGAFSRGGSQNGMSHPCISEQSSWLIYDT